jgi:predicted hydrolase (HD superfamily)
MTREQAYQLLTKYLTNKNLIKHSLAAEATMKGLYRYLTQADTQTAEDEEKWGITGLLHDVDYEVSQKNGDVEQHGTLNFVPDKESIPADILHGIQAHAFEYSKVMPESNMDWAITTCDQLTGLITACALVRPDKKLASVTPESVMKKFNQKAFAAGADRKVIALCEEKLDIPLDKFIEISLTAMQSISDDLGL